MSKKILVKDLRFIQIIADNGDLYGLDRDGQVWIFMESEDEEDQSERKKWFLVDNICGTFE